MLRKLPTYGETANIKNKPIHKPITTRRELNALEHEDNDESKIGFTFCETTVPYAVRNIESVARENFNEVELATDMRPDDRQSKDSFIVVLKENYSKKPGRLVSFVHKEEVI